MNNLSNERLEQIAMYGAQYNTPEARQMALELLALREAGKEPVGFATKRNGNMGSLLFSTKYMAENHDSTALGGKPALSEILPLYAAPQLPAVPEYPELLPCPVLLEPGFRFGKGVPTSSMLGALKRRAERQAELDAMSPEAKAEYDASIEKLKAVLMPDGAEQRLAAAVDLLKQSAPHMLADESLKDPDGALCGKRRAVPEGWVIVPLKPTKDMVMAAEHERGADWQCSVDVWDSMIAAAPKPEVK